MEEIIGFVSDCDFPDNWPDLIDNLGKKCESAISLSTPEECEIVFIAVETVESITASYCQREESVQIVMQIKPVVSEFAPKLLYLLKKLLDPRTSIDPTLSLYSQIPLPDVESSPKHRPHLVDELKEEVVNVFTLCIQKYFEDISGEPNPDSAYAPVAKDTIQNMTSAVWTNLSKMGLIRRFNNCAHASLRFLSCVVN
ncbi:hypothetical protein ADUPG1_002419, partial [Aduncisulcus paluster]